jgi:hypothetical protein
MVGNAQSPLIIGLYSHPRNIGHMQQQKESPFEQVARPLRNLTRGLTRMEAATLGGAVEESSTLLLHTQSAPQGDSVLYMDAEVPRWEVADAQALLKMHIQIHRCAMRMRTALFAVE